MTEPFRIEFVPGVTPDKWLRVWARRMPDSPIEATPVEDAEALGHLRDGSASMALLRLPVDKEGLHVIPLYEEVPVVIVAKEHVVAAFDDVDVADLAAEVLVPAPAHVPEWTDVATAEARERSEAMPPMTTKQAISVVATGSGIVVVPMSVARLHHRKDVVHRAVRGVAPSGVGLAWRADDDDPRIEEFIGIVRGRTERSSRGARQDGPTQPQNAGHAGQASSQRQRRSGKGGSGAPRGRRKGRR